MMNAIDIKNITKEYKTFKLDMVQVNGLNYHMIYRLQQV